MKKILLFVLSLLFTVGAMAESVTWESKSGWTQATGGVANVSWFGAVTPGTTSDFYSFDEFQIMQQATGNENYIAIATENIGQTGSGTISSSKVVAVSNNKVNPSGSGGSLHTYSFDSPVVLKGGTTYYVLFLSSNTPSDGNYSVRQGRISLNHTGYGTYTPGIQNSTTSTWWPYYKASLETVESIEVTYVLMEGGEEKDRQTVGQLPFSAVTYPASWDQTCYDYETTDVIGGANCTVTVNRTVKSKYVESVFARQESVVAGETYAIFNTTVNGTQNRYGFYYAKSSSKLSSQQTRPLSFESNSDRFNDDAYWWVTEDAGDGKFYFKNKSYGTYINGGSNANLRALVSSSSDARAWTVQPWMTSTETKPSVNSLNHDGTTCANSNITAANKLFTVSDESASGNARCWNGNDGGGDGAIALWTSAHPFAFYQAKDVTKVFNTYVLKETNGTVVEKKVVKQVANAPAEIPSDWADNTDYTYAVEGETSDDNVTITVTRTWKEGTVTNLSELSNSKAYTLTTARASLLVDNNQLKSTARVDGLPGKFAIYSYEDNLYLYSLEDNAFIVGAGVESQNPTSVLTFTQMTWRHSENRFQGFLGGNGININDSENGVVVNSWVTADDGNVYAIRAVEDIDASTVAAIEEKLENYFHPSYTVTYKVVDAQGGELWVSDPQPATLGETISEMPAAYKNKAYTTYTDGDPLVVGTDNSQNVFTCTATFENMPFVSFTDFENATWYTASLRGTKQLKYDSTTEPYPTNNSYAESDEYLWAFKGNPYTGIEVYNKATGEGKTLTTVDAGSYPIAVMRDGVQRWTIKQGVGYSDGFLLLDEAWAGNAYINDNANTLRFWISDNAVNDNGSTWRVITPAAKRLNELKAAVATLEAMNYGSDYGQYGFTGEYAGYKGMESTLISGLLTAANAAIASENPASVAEQLTSVQTLLANLAFNVPVNGSAFRVKSVHGTYMRNVAAIKSGTSYRNTLTEDASDLNTLFFFVNGKIYSYGSGKEVLGSGSTFYATNDAWDIRESSITAGKYAFFYTATGTNGIAETKCLYAWGPSSDYPNMMDHQGGEAANTVFTIEAVTEIPVEVSEALHATLFLPVGVQAVDGMTLNGVTSKGNDYLTLEEVAKIEPNTPVIVKADAAGTYNLPVVKNGNKIDGNLLTGVAVGGETLAAEVNAYILGKDELGVGLFPLSATSRELKSWKAYYVPAAETSARAFYFSDVTGLNKANLQNANEGVTYDLQGRRVQNAQKGLYIVNGKKVLVK